MNSQLIHIGALAVLLLATSCSNRRGRNNPTVSPFTPNIAPCAPRALFSELPGGCAPGISTDVAFGDLDGDGDLDALVSTIGQSRLLLQTAPGQLEDSTMGRLPEAFFAANAIELVDVDGDGDLDAVLGITGQSRLYLNNGDATFEDGTDGRIPVEDTNTAGVHALDVDGDGDADLLIANAANCVVDPDDTNCTGTNNVLLLNDGNGTFSEASTMPGDGDTRMFALGDLDGDGDVDAFAAQHFADTSFPTGQFIGRANEPRLSTGGGDFPLGGSIAPAITDRTNAIVLGDVDNDGDLDAFCANSSRSRLLVNDGSAGFVEDLGALDPDEFDTAVLDAAFADLDGDMDLDLIVTGDDRPTRAFANDGAGNFNSNLDMLLPPSLSLGSALEVVDIDGDGDLDLYVANGGDGRAQSDRLLINDGSRLVDLDPPRLPQLPGDALAIATGDLEGDGHIDFAVGTSSGIRFLTNDGTGIYSDVTDMRLGALDVAIEDLALADLDRDGDLDVIAAATNGPTAAEGLQNVLLLNSGNGVMTDVSGSALPDQADASYAVGVADVDADGDLDVLVGNIGVNRLLLNGGSADFQNAAGALPAAANSTEAIVAFDADGDSDVDFVIGNSTRLGGDPQNRLLLNDGTGVFVDATAARFPADDQSTNDLAQGDVDSDGDIDVIAANDEQTRLYLNDGTGVFVDETASRLPGATGRAERVSLFDADGDGDLDILLSAAGQGTRLLENVGSGAFVDATATTLPAGGAAAESVTVDVDLDQDLDLVLLGSGQSRLMINRLRQLDRTSMAMLGGQMRFTVTAAPGTDREFQAIPFVAILGTPQPIFVGEGGFVQVETLISNKLSPFTIGPPDNAATSTIDIPDDPSLLGESLFMQVILSEIGTGEARLSNLLRTPFVE